MYKRDVNSIVVQVGDSALEAARYMVVARGSSHVSASNLAEAAKSICNVSCSTALVVSSMDTESPGAFIQFAEQVASEAPDIALGFLYGRGSEQLLEAATRLPKVPSVVDAEMSQIAFAHQDFKDFIGGAHVVDARSIAQTQAGLAELISSPIELLYLLGHSNGQDEGFDRIVLCCQPSVPAVEESVRALPCYRGAECRFQRSELRRVSTYALRATCVVNLTCWGVTLADTPFSAHLSVGEGLLRHASVTTLLTTVRSASVDHTDFLALYYLCNMGWPMGMVANKANQFRLERGLRGDILCFGDPETRILGRVVDLEAELIDKRTIKCRLPPLRKRTDVRIQLSDGSWSEPSFGLIKKGGDVNNGLLGLSAFFTTLPPRNRSGSLKVEIIGESDLEVLERHLKQLVLDLRYFDRLISVGTTDFAHSEPTSLKDLTNALMVLKEVLLNWPLATVRMGSAVSEEVVARWWDSLRCYLDDLLESLLKWYAGLYDPSGLNAMNLVRRYYRRASEVSASTACPYCGSPVDELLWSAFFESDERRFGLCQACGPVYDGDPSIGPWLRTNGTFVVGSSTRVRIDVKNPYGIPLSARSVVVLTRFDQEAQLPIYSQRVMLGPGSAGKLITEISTPATYVAGVYYLKAALVVGAKVNYLRCPVLITKTD